MATLTFIGAGQMASALTFPTFENGHEVRLVGTPLDRDVIDLYARGYRKVIENHTQLLDDDRREAQGGHWYGFDNQ